MMSEHGYLAMLLQIYLITMSAFAELRAAFMDPGILPREANLAPSSKYVRTVTPSFYPSSLVAI